MRGFLLAAVLAGPALANSFLLIPESTNDVVSVFDAADGSLISANFIDLNTAAAADGYTGSLTPIEAIEVGNEVWVSDQVADRIWRFDGTGGYLGSVGVGELDNIRGMEVVGNTVFVANGGGGGATPEGVATIDVGTLSVTGSFANAPAGDISFYDVELYNGELLVSNIDSGNDAIERYATDGTFLGFFAQSDGVSDFDFLQQMASRGSNGNLLGGGFSLPSGVYEWQSDGTALGITAGLGFGPRGVYELANGDVLWTNGTWVRTDSDIKAEGASYRYITPASVPEPGALLLCLTGGALLLRRRS